MSAEPLPPDDFASLYRRAFQEHRARALWSMRQLDAPMPEDALVVARALRVNGNRDARCWRNRSKKRAAPLPPMRSDCDNLKK